MYTVLTVYIGMEIKVDAGGIAGKKRMHIQEVVASNRQAVYERNLEWNIINQVYIQSVDPTTEKASVDPINGTYD